MLNSSRLLRLRGLVCLRRNAKLHSWSFGGIDVVHETESVKSLALSKAPRPLLCSSGTCKTLYRLIHCTRSQAVKTCTSHYKQKDPSQYDFQSDPDVQSWLSEMSSDFGDEPSPGSPNTENENASATSDTSSSGGEDTGYSSDASSSSSEESEDEAPDTVKSSQVEEIDYEEFFLEEEAIRHEDLIEELPLPVELKRGQTGVFDVEEIVKVLEEENGEDICVIPVPPDINYTDNLVIVTGKSFRHLLGMAELIKWIYKRKRSDQDPASVRIEGLQSKDWLALDLGNMVLHLMMEKVRKKYDIESLWLLGPEKDPQCQEWHNPYILTPQTEDSAPPTPEEYPLDISPSNQKDPEFYGMQSVAGWHEDVNDFPKSSARHENPKRPTDSPVTKS